MDIKNLSRTEKLAIIEAHNKSIAHYQGIIDDINQDKKGERKLIAARISTIIDREVYTHCDLIVFGDDYLELINEALYENSQINALVEFSNAIVDNSDINLQSLKDSNLFYDVFDDAQALIDEHNGNFGNDALELDLSSDNTALALQVQRAYSEMGFIDQVEVIDHFDYHSDIEPLNYFVVSDYLAEQLRELGQSVPELGNLNIMINCAWSLTENSDIIAIADSWEYDTDVYTGIIKNYNADIVKLKL